MTVIAAGVFVNNGFIFIPTIATAGAQRENDCRSFLQVFAEQVLHAGFLFFDGAFRNT